MMMFQYRNYCQTLFYASTVVTNGPLRHDEYVLASKDVIFKWTSTIV